MDRFSELSAAEEARRERRVCHQCHVEKHYTECNDEGTCFECVKQNRIDGMNGAELALCDLSVAVLGVHPAETEGMNPDQIVADVIKEFNFYKFGALKVTTLPTLKQALK